MSTARPAAAPWKIRLLLLGLSTLVALGGAELFCRLRIQRLNRKTLAASLERPLTLNAGGQATLGDLIQLSDDDRIAYELRPGLEGVIFKDRPVTTNSHGMRGPEVPLEPAPGEVTILGIGDSVLFGHGVADGECYLDQLRQLLIQRHPEKKWRVINTGVPGYNTVMEVETLETKGLAFHPDLVILGLVGNDYEPPVYVRDPEDPWDLSHSFLLDFLQEGLSGGDEASYLRRAGLQVRASRFEGKEGPGAAPPRYAELYGRGAFEGAIERLVQVWKREGFELLAFTNISYNEPPYDFNKAPEMLAYVREAGIPAFDMQPVVDEALEEETGRPFSVDDYKVSDLVVSPDNLHPSVRGHRLIAETLYGELERRGILERLLR